MKKTILVLLTMSALALANPVSVTFVDPPTGVEINNGSVYVGPHALTIDGLLVLGTNISWDLELEPPYTWDAGETPLPNTQPFLSIAWLDLQFSSSSDWAGIQDAIWDESGASYADANTLSWLASANDPANYGSVNRWGFEILQPDIAGYIPSFIIQSPEPATFLLIGMGLVGLSIVRRRIK